MQTHNLAQFQKTATDFVLGLKPLRDRATVVGLYGDLGSGKTTFVQSAAKALGVTETLNSPTFLIFKKYQLPHLSPSPPARGGVSSLRDGVVGAKGEAGRGCFGALIHVDAYRLKSSDELRKLRFSDLLADPANLILIEWADRVADILPHDHTKLFFEFVGTHTRSIAVA